MPRFFFSLTNGDTIADDKATPCNTIDEAKVVALAIAAELGRNKPPNEIKNLAICVTDKTGREVFRTSSSALRATADVWRNYLDNTFWCVHLHGVIVSCG
jgi:hypothetical protein